MPGDIQVFLIEDIPNLGRAGDIVNVSEGYARNALFPQGRAALATKQTQSQKNAKDAAAKKKAEEELSAMQAIAAKLENTELSISKKIKEGDELYGSVTQSEAAKILSEQSGKTVAPRAVTGDFPIKSLGSYPVTVRLLQDVEFQMFLVVVSDEE